jgi:magnesium chelatase family protein
VQVDRLSDVELSSDAGGHSTEAMRLRVMRAVEMQKERSEADRFVFNGQLNQRQIRKYCEIDFASKKIMAQAVHQMGLSARAYDRILRVSRTIADLCASEKIASEHILEALRYRQLRAS